jgi:ornithine cyclodeaminase/alanine dehydrogenase-like protein (mu-crystallin family)
VTRLLTRSDVAAVLTLPDCIAAVEQAFGDYDAGRLPKSESLGFRAASGTFHVKAAGATLFAAKINANFPANPARHGLPTIQGLIVIMDLEHGAPLAVLDSTLITTLRTAAATAVAAKHLARADACRAAIIGCGAQGRASVTALREVRPLTHARLYDVDARASAACAAALRDAAGFDVTCAASLDAAVDDADIIVTCTPAAQPFLEPRHVRPGVFVAAVGADNPQKCEITAEVMAQASIVPDLLDQAATMGDLRHAIAVGQRTRGDVHGELGATVNGRVPGRRTADEIFVFDSTGSALQDVVVAAIAVERAASRGLGSMICFAPDHEEIR